MAAKNPVTYAEVELGVHATYERAQVAAENRDRASRILGDLQSKRREAQEKLDEAEMLIASSVYGDPTLTSQAARDKALKVAIAGDTECRDLRSDVASLSDAISDAERDIRAQELQIKIESARMVELGGYFQYLSVAKVEQMQKAAQTTNPASPWASA